MEWMDRKEGETGCKNGRGSKKERKEGREGEERKEKGRGKNK